MSNKKVIRLNENDIEKLVKKIIKENSETSLLNYVLNAMIKSNLVSTDMVTDYGDRFEVYGFNGPDFNYFLDNHIVFEGENEIFLNFEMYEEDVDMEDALEVSNWLYPKLTKLFGEDVTFFDNLDNDEDYI
jgi:hypothetical protein